MSHVDQLSELIRLWNCLDDSQREGILGLLRIIIIVEEGGRDDDGVEIQDDDDGD